LACKNDSTQEDVAEIPEKEITDTTKIGENAPLPAWAKKSTVYGVDMRHYTPSGTINSFSDFVPRVKDLGAEIITFHNLLPFDPKSKKGSEPQLPSISDYKGINPSLGTGIDFKNLINKIHAYQLRALIEINITYTSWNHPWIKEHPEYYLKEANGNIQSYPTLQSYRDEPYRQGAALDYKNPKVIEALTQVLSYWVTEYDVDGFQLNLPYNAPIEFKPNLHLAISAVKNDLFIITDYRFGDENRPYYTAFYNLYDQFNKIAVGYAPFSTLAIWKDTEKQLPFLPLYYISNPIENAINGSVIERMSDAYMAINVFMFTAKGMPYIYNGQEEPIQKRLSLWEKDNINFGDYKAVRFYQDLINFKKNNPAIWNTPYGGLTTSISENRNVFGIKRSSGDNTVYVLINMSGQDQNVTLKEEITGMKDLFQKTEINHPKGEEFQMKPWTFYVYSNLVK
jgi:glycosidase